MKKNRREKKQRKNGEMKIKGQGKTERSADEWLIKRLKVGFTLK